MENKKIQGYLEKLQNNPAALELMKGMDTPQNQEEEIKAYAELAGKLGYDITESDLKEYLIRMGNRMQQKTEEASAQIQELPDEALEHVAGGKKEHEECKDTYRDYENCWFNDGCDWVYRVYDQYLCHALAYKNPCHENGTPCVNGAQ